MAKLKKDELIAKLTAAKVELTGKEKVSDLEKLFAKLPAEKLGANTNVLPDHNEDAAPVESKKFAASGIAKTQDEKTGEVLTINPQGRFVIVEVLPEKFRMFGLVGTAVSPVYGVNDVNPETNAKYLTQLQKDCSRHNNLQKIRKNVSKGGASGYLE